MAHLPNVFSAGITSGLIAGAAGTTALNLVSYVRQTVQATPSSATPDQAAESVVRAVGAEVPGTPDERQNRLEGLGPLAGLGVGLGVGALAGGLRATTLKVPFPAAVAAVGLGAMAISDTVMAVLGISSPRPWTPASVAQDAAPHLTYGAVTILALHRMLDPHTVQVR